MTAQMNSLTIESQRLMEENVTLQNAVRSLILFLFLFFVLFFF